MGESAAVPLVEPAAGGDDEPFLGLAWAEAIEGAELLRSALVALGLADEIPRLRGDVNVYGRPMVTVGRISPTAARRLAAALSRAAQHQPRVYGQAPPGAGDGGGGCPLPTTNGVNGANGSVVTESVVGAPVPVPVAVPVQVPVQTPAPLPVQVPVPVPMPVSGRVPMSGPVPMPARPSGPSTPVTPRPATGPVPMPVTPLQSVPPRTATPAAAPRTAGGLPTTTPPDSLRLPA